MDFINNPEKPQEKIFSILFKEDELTWQNIIYDLVRQEGMDPWDIDVSEIAQKFLEMLKKLREMDFRVSGKVVLAAALLLKIKSNRLLEEDIQAWDNLINSMDEPDSLLDEFPLDENGQPRPRSDHPKLMPKTPQPRKRKVSVDDLIRALEKALEVDVRRPPVYVPPKVQLHVPTKVIDVGEMINDIYVKVQEHYTGQPEPPERILTFSQLVPSDLKEDKVYTFIPLLHLEHQRKVDMNQKVHFGEININLARIKPIQISTEPAEVEVQTTIDGKPVEAKPEEAPKRKRKAKESAPPAPSASPSPDNPAQQ